LIHGFLSSRKEDIELIVIFIARASTAITSLYGQSVTSSWIRVYTGGLTAFIDFEVKDRDILPRRVPTNVMYRQHLVKQEAV
jgi:hypothetical protein